jgi:hypothetical protein
MDEIVRQSSVDPMQMYEAGGAADAVAAELTEVGCSLADIVEHIRALPGPVAIGYH